MEGTTNYEINFFKPRTAFLKDNVRVIVIGITIWAVCVYGFHIFMKIIEKKTPEAGYLVYEQVYPKFADGAATAEDNINIAKVYLNLIGKSITLQKSAALKEGFTAAAYNAMPEEGKDTFTKIAAEAATNKRVDVKPILTALGIEKDVVLKGVVSFALVPYTDQLSVTAPEIPAIMDKYLIHNQSFLTDSKLFGFPFHYFYSAVFLLALFNIICLVYCFVIDRIMKKHGMEKDDE
jgi:uncharacterized membrane protein